jgi:tetratricopeptide (TPR) repeat protein
VSKPAASPIVLEHNKRLSECLLWRHLEAYYTQFGQDAWKHIPLYPTSNPYIAETYAELVLQFLLEAQDTLNRDQPLYILELATGTGTFSFYMLQHLTAKLSSFEALAGLRWCYVMTDFAEKNIQAWQENPIFQPFVEAGRLDFSVYRPDTQCGLSLQQGQPFHTGGNPLIALANYFFDSLPQELFRVDGGQLLEGRVRFSVPTFPLSTDPGEAMASLKKEEFFIPMTGPYSEDPVWQGVLDHYTHQFEEASFLLPVGTFRCLDNLRALSHQRLVLLSSDKGFTRPSYMKGHFEQHYALHHGAFSFMVNYDAIGRYMESHGGVCLKTDDPNPMVATAMAILEPPDQPTSPWEQTRHAFHRNLIQQNPLNDLFYAQGFLFNAGTAKPSEQLDTYMAMIRLAQYDPVIFCGCAEKIYERLNHSSKGQRTCLAEALFRVEKNVFSIRAEHNTLFWIGKLYYGLAQRDAIYVDEALRVFQRALEILGEADCYSMFHVAACYEMQGKDALALSHYQTAARYLTTCELTQAAIARLSARLAGPQNP